MRKIYTFPLLLAGLLATSEVDAQFYNIGDGITPQDVNNSGVVAATASNITSLRWTVSEGLTEIGTLAVGELAGKPLVGEDPNRMVVYLTNPATNLNEISLYDHSTQSITYLGGIEGSSDYSKSSPWGMSEDGTTIVGLGWADAANGQAIKWSETEGIVNLADLSTRASRANGISQDKNVIVGWQDTEIGFRQAAVWKNGVKTILTDQLGEPISELSEVSGDGRYGIGFNGYYPYIWNEETGVTTIDHPYAGNFFRGGATGINYDGSKIVGYFRGWPGGPAFGEGFIWTPTEGRQELNTYVNSLGIDTQGLTLSLPLAISPDGTKIVGVARDTNFNIFGFYLDLTNYLNTADQITVSKSFKIYPNPVTDIISIEGLTRKATVEITNMIGQKIKSEETTSGKINVQSLQKGNYMIMINDGQTTMKQPFIKK